MSVTTTSASPFSDQSDDHLRDRFDEEWVSADEPEHLADVITVSGGCSAPVSACDHSTCADCQIE